MPLPEIGRWAVAILLTAVLTWASVSDIRDRRIPNWTVLAVVGLFIPWALLAHGSWVLWALAGGAIALVISFVLYVMNVVGAGDSKLFAATALFAGLSHLTQLAMFTTLAGGVIGAVSLATRPRRALVMVSMRGKGDFGRGIPYGVAIAIGALLVVWAPLLHLALPEQM